MTRRISPGHVIQYLCRNELGPSRRDPQGALSGLVGSRLHLRERPLHHKRLQGASAMGGSTVSERELRASGLIPRSAAFDIGATLARVAHANRACVQSVRHVDEPARTYAHYHRQENDSRRCTLHNWTEKSVQEVHG